MIEETDNEYEKTRTEGASRFSKYRSLHTVDTWNSGTAESWDPKSKAVAWQEPYDRVVQTKLKSRELAEKHLKEYCKDHNVKRVSAMFHAHKYWCIRVKEIK